MRRRPMPQLTLEHVTGAGPSRVVPQHQRQLAHLRLARGAAAQAHVGVNVV